MGEQEPRHRAEGETRGEAQGGGTRCKLAEQDDDFEDSESDDDGETRPKKSLGDMYTSEALAGLRVRHGVDEVAEGETVVLTLKDSSILD